MSITKSLVAQMDGEIRVESVPGQGSAFTVVLPLAADQEACSAPDREPERPPFSLKGLRLLLAEDNEINMEITTELLTAQGAQVTKARDGREAVERFR